MFRVPVLICAIALSCGGVMGNSFFPEDLSTVKWQHAVNSKEELTNALKSDAHMLEADVSINADKEPIMAHPPAETSDLSLKEFLDTVQNASKKGIKLDFKSTDAYNASVPFLQKFKTTNFSYPVWLNADILKGPGSAEEPKVNPKTFLDVAKANFPTWTLSVGWTTKWTGSENYTYTEEDIAAMNSTLIASSIVQPVTFAVRAAIAAKSDASLKKLVTVQNNSTLTVWSSAEDKNIIYDSLRKTINEIGRKRVFVDMPADQLKLLNSGVQAVLSSACVLLAVGAHFARLW